MLTYKTTINPSNAKRVIKEETHSSHWGRISAYGGLLCLGADAQVLTTAGWKPIDKVSAVDQVWDGIEWVSHSGVTLRGIKPTMRLDGVPMTIDHEVLTNAGWVWAAQARGLYRAKVWLPNCAPRCGNDRTETNLESALHMRQHCYSGDFGNDSRSLMWVHAHEAYQQSTNDAWNVPSSGVCSMAFDARPLSFTDTPSLEELWRAGHQGLQTLAEKFRKFLGRHGADLQTRAEHRTPQQQSRLFPGELLLGDSATTGFEPTFDLVDCGPRRRFVVRGDTGPLIVHNCENAVQGLARDVMAEAMLRVNAAGYPVVLTVHDEVVAEAPATRSAKEFRTIMEMVPHWAKGFPIAAKAWQGDRYKKD
jgi:hypothetical protein